MTALVRTGIDVTGPSVLLSARSPGGQNLQWRLHRRSAASLGALITAAAVSPDDCELECVLDSDLETRPKDRP